MGMRNELRLIITINSVRRGSVKPGEDSPRYTFTFGLVATFEKLAWSLLSFDANNL